MDSSSSDEEDLALQDFSTDPLLARFEVDSDHLSSNLNEDEDEERWLFEELAECVSDNEEKSTTGHGLNLSVLDDMVLEFLLYEGLIDVDDSLSSEKIQAISKLQNFRQHLADVYGAIVNGDIDSAMQNAEKVLEGPLPPQLVMYFLQLKLRFLVEQQLCSNAVMEPIWDDVLLFLQKEYAPVALDAYPSAFAEFKQSLISLLQRESSPRLHVDWLEEAAKVCQTLIITSPLPSPRLSFLLNYLLAARAASVSPKGFVGWLEQMLTEENVYSEIPLNTDPPYTTLVSPTFNNVPKCLESVKEFKTLYSKLVQVSVRPSPVDMCPPDTAAVPVETATKQALTLCCCLSYEDATSLLYECSGDKQMAMRRGLSRLCVNPEPLLSMLCEYCLHRGIGKPFVNGMEATSPDFALLRQLQDAVSEGDIRLMVCCLEEEMLVQLRSSAPVVYAKLYAELALTLYNEGQKEEAQELLQKMIAPLATENTGVLSLVRNLTPALVLGQPFHGPLTDLRMLHQQLIDALSSLHHLPSLSALERSLEKLLCFSRSFLLQYSMFNSVVNAVTGLEELCNDNPLMFSGSALRPSAANADYGYSEFGPGLSTDGEEEAVGEGEEALAREIGRRAGQQQQGGGGEASHNEDNNSNSNREESSRVLFLRAMENAPAARERTASRQQSNESFDNSVNTLMEFASLPPEDARRLLREFGTVEEVLLALFP